MTTIIEGLKWATERGRLIRRFRPRDSDEQAQLEEWWTLARATAHEHVGRRDFTAPPIPTQEWIDGVGLADADPAEILAAAAIPESIREGIARYIAALWQTRHRAPGVVSKSVAGISEAYDLWAVRHPGELPLQEARGYWDPWILDATTRGGSPSL
jgi:hypothetical protein